MDQSETDNSTEAASDSSAEQTQRTSPASSDSSAGGDKSTDEPTDSEDNSARTASGGSGDGAKRRRGSRGGQSRRGAGTGDGPSASVAEESSVEAGPTGADDRNDVEMPEPLSEGRPSAEASEKALVRRPKIGDTMPVPNEPPPGPAVRPSDGDSQSGDSEDGSRSSAQKRRRRRGSGTGGSGSGGDGGQQRARETDSGGRGKSDDGGSKSRSSNGQSKKGRRGGRGRGRGKSGEPATQMDEAMLEQRRGRERNGKPIGRYFMAVQVRPGMAQVGVLEGRSLIEHYVSRPADDISQIHGNIYIGRVQNVLPGMEAAFVDIATPKNAVLYRGDVQYDPADVDVKGKNPRIEDILKNRQLIICQVTKNPIGHKGARLTQEVSLPGRFVVLIPNSKTYGISKRLTDNVRKRLRGILDRVKPDEHGLIVRTAAETATEEELRADMTILLDQWNEIAAKAANIQKPTLLYREPELAVRVIREEFNAEYRGVVIDDERLHHEVKSYVAAFNPELAGRIEYYDVEQNGLSLFERQHIHEQVHKALDRKVWLPSGGSLIIEHTEALTVIDVNTGKNVGKSNLEETVFHNNVEAAEEIAKQLRLRDIGGIIVIDFIDMEIRDNRAKVVEVFRNALARDKTRSQVFDITELGLVEMTRKRIGEGLLTEFSEQCPDCEGRGVLVDYKLLE
jgi:ribonuclease E